MNAKPPPAPGPLMQPHHAAVEEAVQDVTFPISKRELMQQVADKTALVNGRNVDMRELVRDLNDDFFESEDEFREALDTVLDLEDPSDMLSERPARKSASGRDVVEDALEEMD